MELIQQYLGYFLGFVLMPVVQWAKGRDWWPGKKAGKPFDPRPVLVALVAVGLFFAAVHYSPDMTVREVWSSAETAVLQAGTGALGGLGLSAILHWGMQKLRELLKKKLVDNPPTA